MSSTESERLIAEFPEEAGGVRRLLDFLESFPAASRAQVALPIARIFDVMNPSSQRALALVLSRLVNDGVLKQVFNIERNGSGVAQYDSLDEVPVAVKDDNQDLDISVRPEDIHVYFKLVA